MAQKDSDDKQRITLRLSQARVACLDALKKEWGMRNRGDVLERLLEEIFAGSDAEIEAEVETGSSPDGSEASPEEEPDDGTALVLVGRGELETLSGDGGAPTPTEQEPGRPQGGGIDLPGFVRRRSQQLRHSYAAPATRQGGASLGPLPRVPAEPINEALEATRQHWLELYGKPANEAVLEAAMTWLAQEIWPQSDPCEGRRFTWSAASRVLSELAEGWDEGPPSFERVIVGAGLLEDPFSGATLPVRIPTLIRRFVHRFRRRRKGSSFQTLEHTMTLQGALRLLQLPTDPGHRVSLGQIREAYRELALRHHPDSGGSLEAMRRLNEAYQLLKELYRS